MSKCYSNASTIISHLNVKYGVFSLSGHVDLTSLLNLELRKPF